VKKKNQKSKKARSDGQYVALPFIFCLLIYFLYCFPNFFSTCVGSISFPTIDEEIVDEHGD
jgi:hypothetical protein